MNNFILFHKDCTLPDYITTCIKQIQGTQKNYTIHLLTDNPCINISNIKIVNTNDINTEYLQKIDFYKNDSNPLWKNSFERFFYIKEYIVQNNISNVVHFDNDVLVYYDLNNIITNLQENIVNIGITQHKQNEMVCGFMFIKNKNSLTNICNELLKLVKNGVNFLTEKFNGDMPHEMRLLGHIYHSTNELTSLPGTPFDTNFTKFGYVFDPSTYGQFFSGSGNLQENTVHPQNYHRLIDRYIVNGTIIPFFDRDKKLPFIKFKEQVIPIFNLHIHSKNLQRFSFV